MVKQRRETTTTPCDFVILYEIFFQGCYVAEIMGKVSAQYFDERFNDVAVINTGLCTPGDFIQCN